jgi:hypothetical protein
VERQDEALEARRLLGQGASFRIATKVWRRFGAWF